MTILGYRIHPLKRKYVLNRPRIEWAGGDAHPLLLAEKQYIAVVEKRLYLSNRVSVDDVGPMNLDEVHGQLVGERDEGVTR